MDDADVAGEPRSRERRHLDYPGLDVDDLLEVLDEV
jgi:hypothetical protein